MAITEQALLDKIRELPEHRQAQVEDFVDFLFMRKGDHRLASTAAKASEANFRTRDNDEDSA